jgi:anti-anti-sigma factor
VLAAGITNEVDVASLVAGFLFVAAIDVVIGELPKRTGTDVTGSNPIQELWSWLGTLGEAHPRTVIVGAIALCALVGVLAGVLIGIGLSLIWLITVATHPAMPTLEHESGTQVFREADERVAVIRFDGGLFFATADVLEDRLREIIRSSPELTGIVLDCDGINFVASQGAAKMADLVTLVREADVNLHLMRLKPAVWAILGRECGDTDRSSS